MMQVELHPTPKDVVRSEGTARVYRPRRPEPRLAEPWRPMPSPPMALA